MLNPDKFVVSLLNSSDLTKAEKKILHHALQEQGLRIKDGEIVSVKLEKQDEQKPTDVRTWKYIVDAVLTEREGIGNYLDSPWTTEVAEKLQKRFGKIEQKPAEKVEPKFKVGDWVVYCNEDVDLITGIEENGYCINNGGYIPFVCESDVRLWTIQDAKDGDVLVSDYEGGVCITILKSVVSSNEIEMYCHSINSELFIAQSGFSNATWHPATKEQRDTLMKAMADAGYAFDFEKIVLKKIEQKPEWSEEDDKHLQIAINYTFSGGYLSTVDWLKSLRDRYTWKPSDEQIEALEHFVRGVGESGYASPYDNNTKLLYSLLSDLKKLSEK